MWLIIFLFLSFNLSAQQNTEASRREIIQFGTDTEIANLIQALRNEKEDYLDDELVEMAQSSKNQRVLSSVFAFFAEREKSGLEGRAIKAIDERENESNDSVLAAIDYLGRVKTADAAETLIELIDTEERRFLNSAFRALGRAGSADKITGDKAADFLINFYEKREPADDSKREIITAIGASGSSNGVKFLKEIALDDGERVPLRIAALDALSKIGDNEGLNAIITSVSANDPNVRSAAVGALGPFSGSDVDSAILDAFRDSYYRTRIAAAQASRERKLEAAVPFLKFRAERDEVPNVREEAVRALGAIGSKEANEILEGLFAERRNSERIRILSSEMLSKNNALVNAVKLIEEAEEAKKRTQTNLYNGLLKVISETVFQGDKTELLNITGRFLRSGTPIEKLYALDIIAVNKLKGYEEEIKKLAEDKNESMARRAKRTLEMLE